MDSSPLEELLSALSSDRAAGLKRSREDYLSIIPEEQAEERRLAWTLLGLALADEVADEEARRAEAPTVDFAEETTDPTSLGAPGALGVEIGSYRLIRELGRGGMGVVYLARDPALDRDLALKLLPATLVRGDSGRERFRREAKVASRLDHPQLCGVLAFGDQDGLAWIAMPYVRGRTLDALLKENPAHFTDDWRVAVRLVESLSRAMHHAHEAGVVHRDLKPANVMMPETGLPVILDFGLARDLAEEAASLTQSGEVFGTPFYMAPEQIRGESRVADGRLDVWALGVMLRELVSGQRPFSGPSREALYRSILEDEPQSLRAAGIRVPRDLEVVIATAMEKDVARRYASAEAFAEDLNALLENRSIAARPPGTLERGARFARRRPALTALLLILLVGGPLVAMFVTQDVLEGQRDRDAARSALGAAGDALERGDPARARQLIDQARALASEVAGAEDLLTRCADLEALDRIEALALDREIDPDGRLALGELAATTIAAAPSRRAVLEIHALRRRDGDAAAARRAEELVGSLPRTMGRLLVASTTGAELPQPPDGDVDAALAVALGLSARGRHREALTALERILEQRPTAHALAWAAAEEASRMQAYDAALGFASRARAATSATPPRRLARYGLHLRRAGLSAEALAVARTAAAAAPDDPVVNLHLADCLAASEEREEARALLDRLIEAAPNHARVWRSRGCLSFDERRFETARSDLEQAVALAPRDADAQLDLGNTLIKLRRADEAESRLRDALALRPDFPFALNSLATALRDQGKTEDALTTVREAISRRPDYGDAIATLASILHRQGKLEAAERHYREAIAKQATTTAVLFNLAILIEGEKPEEAAGLYRQLLDREPDDVAALVNLANLLSEADRHVEAIALAKRACTLDPHDVINWNALATVQNAGGMAEDAIKSLRRAVAAKPDRIEPHANLMFFQEKIDPLSAVAHGEIFFALDPSYEKQFAEIIRRLREIAAAGDAETPVALALRLEGEEWPDPATLRKLSERTRALPEGALGTRAWGLRRGGLAVLARTARRIGLKEEAEELRKLVVTFPSNVTLPP